MAQPPAPNGPGPTEKTFTSYNQEQGEEYAKTRRDYHPNVYQTVMSQHTSTGGQLDTMLDIGCGPGLAARSLAPHFPHVIGLDPSEAMIATARSKGGVTSTSEPIRFDISTAESLGNSLSPPVLDTSVDLITASNAAHWFDMPRFWASAARVLKPGGSVALWTSGEGSVHPSTPNAAAIQAAYEEITERELKPYFTPGNLLARDSYASLPLPWTLEQPIPEFDESTFFRKDWNGDAFHEGGTEIDLDMFEKMMGTSSVVTRWRQAHPDDVGTERDVLKEYRREVERLLHEAGVAKGEEKVKGISRGAVLIVKKKS